MSVQRLILVSDWAGRRAGTALSVLDAAHRLRHGGVVIGPDGQPVEGDWIDAGRAEALVSADLAKPEGEVELPPPSAGRSKSKQRAKAIGDVNQTSGREPTVAVEDEGNG